MRDNGTDGVAGREGERGAIGTDGGETKKERRAGKRRDGRIESRLQKRRVRVAGGTKRVVWLRSHAVQFSPARAN